MCDGNDERGGYDEHGPAYPGGTSLYYRCPVCAIRDRDAYLRCYDGGCPDGRDQARFKRLAQIYDPYGQPNEWEREQRRIKCVPCLFMTGLVFAAIIVGLIGWVLNWAVTGAHVIS